MNILRYACLHLRRNVKTALITLVSFLVALIVILFIQQSVHSRQKTLESMASAIEIRGEVADSFGNQTELLQLDRDIPAMFLGNFSISKLVKDVSVKSNFQCLIDGQNSQLIAITNKRADQTLYYDGDIFYEDGFDESIWMTTDMVCAISPEMSFYCYEDENGNTYLDIAGRFYNTRLREYMEVPMTLRVIGQAVAQGKVYCPYLMLQSVCNGLQNVPYWADSLAFTVKDNTRLDELRTYLRPYFGDSDIQNAGAGYNTVILKDAEYLRLTGEAQKNLEIMAFLQPILYLCALGAGVMLVVMQMRGRTKEMAVIRSLGAGRFRVMAQSLLEYALICLPVTLFALLVWRELSRMTVIGVWLAFMAGALCTIVRFSMIPLFKQIRELEE